MPTLTGFTRPVDPISSDELARKITSDTGKTVTVIVNPSTVDVTGASISGDDTTAIQTSITSYVYIGPSYGNVVTTADNSDMSAARHTAIISEYAAYTNDLINFNLASAKTANRTYINGVAKNGTAATGDIVEWIVTLTTASGTVTDYVTTQGATRTSGGTALLSTLFPDSIQTNFIDSSGVYAQGGPTVTSNKTVSIPFTKQGFSGVTLLSTQLLGSVAMNAIPDGVVVKLRLVGVAA